MSQPTFKHTFANKNFTAEGIFPNRYDLQEKGSLSSLIDFEKEKVFKNQLEMDQNQQINSNQNDQISPQWQQNKQVAQPEFYDYQISQLFKKQESARSNNIQAQYNEKVKPILDKSKALQLLDKYINDKDNEREAHFEAKRRIYDKSFEGHLKIMKQYHRSNQDVLQRKGLDKKRCELLQQNHNQAFQQGISNFSQCRILSSQQILECFNKEVQNSETNQGPVPLEKLYSRKCVDLGNFLYEVCYWRMFMKPIEFHYEQINKQHTHAINGLVQNNDSLQNVFKFLKPNSYQHSKQTLKKVQTE